MVGAIVALLLALPIIQRHQPGLIVAVGGAPGDVERGAVVQAQVQGDAVGVDLDRDLELLLATIQRVVHVVEPGGQADQAGAGDAVEAA